MVFKNTHTHGTAINKSKELITREVLTLGRGDGAE